jgi:hypothetical protein
VLSNEALKTVSVGPAKTYGLHAARCVAPASECVPPGHGAHDDPPDEYESAAQSAAATRTTQMHAAAAMSARGCTNSAIVRPRRGINAGAAPPLPRACTSRAPRAGGLMDRSERKELGQLPFSIFGTVSSLPPSLDSVKRQSCVSLFGRD